MAAAQSQAPCRSSAAVITERRATFRKGQTGLPRLNIRTMRVVTGRGSRRPRTRSHGCPLPRQGERKRATKPDECQLHPPVSCVPSSSFAPCSKGFVQTTSTSGQDPRHEKLFERREQSKRKRAKIYSTEE